MEDKGCQIAYNLDGGQSGTLLFNGKVYNKIAYKGVERAMSDILYFGSAE
jgi:exopolysaccharide biosynthesis protein